MTMIQTDEQELNLLTVQVFLIEGCRYHFQDCDDLEPAFEKIRNDIWSEPWRQIYFSLIENEVQRLRQSPGRPDPIGSQ